MATSMRSRCPTFSASLRDGRRSVQDVARDAATSVYATAVALAEMAKSGLITRGQADWDEQPAPKRGKKTSIEPDATEALHDLAEEDEEPSDVEEASDADEPAPTPASRRGTVRSLRAPTREEQRIRLRR